MKKLRFSFGIALALSFVITVVPALILFNLDRRAFSADTYRQVFANEGFYNRLPRVLAETLNATSFVESEMPLAMRGMGLPAWEAFFRALLPPATLESLGEQTLSSMFAYVNLEANSAEMDLLPLKRNMTGDAGVAAVYALLSTQPDCTVDQVTQMASSLLSLDSFQFCNPPDRLRPLMTPLIAGQLQAAALVIPERATLLSAEGLTPEEDPRLALQNLRSLMRLTPLVPLACLLLLTLSMVTSLNSWLDWWGTPLLACGALAMLAGAGGSPVIGRFLKNTIAREAPAYLPTAFSDYAGDLGEAMVKALTRPILAQGVVLAILGSGMIGVSYLLRRRQLAAPAGEEETLVE
jgi:hypothetical protein